MNRLLHLVLGAVLGAALAACGGAGNTVAEGGIGGTGISSGSISAFSSIVVNGTTFDVDAAVITVNGQPALQDALDIGYVVRVDGDLGDGVAEAVRFDADLIGPVTDIANIPIDGTFEVMKQNIRVTATTVLSGGIGAVTELTGNENVLVSGFRNSTDVLVATHLEVLPTGPSSNQVVGTVTQSQPTQFQINDLVVISNEEPEVGQRVLLRGTYDAGEISAPNTVTEVEDLFIAGAEIEVEGIVSNFSAANPASFKVDGIPVDASGATIVDETGAPAGGQIDNNVEVEVEGVFNTSGVVIAERIEVELEDNVEIVAQVVNDPPQGGPIQLFLFGTPLVTVEVTEKTRVRDNSSQDLDNFRVADLAQNDWVEIDAFENTGTGQVTALKIERFDPDPDLTQQDVSVEGIVDDTNVVLKQLTILGMVFATTGATIFHGVADLSGISDGEEVEVKWKASAGFTQPQLVDEVELE